MRADCLRSNHCESDLIGFVPRFVVEVVKHFDVIGQKADRGNRDRLDSLSFQVAEMIADVRSEPQIFRASAAALINQLPTSRRDADRFRDEPTGLGELLGVVASVGHSLRNAVRGEGDVNSVALFDREFGECVSQAIGVRSDEAGVIEEGTDLLDDGGVGTGDSSSLLDVFEVLPTA